jgi:hypothetical protein
MTMPRHALSLALAAASVAGCGGDPDDPAADAAVTFDASTAPDAGPLGACATDRDCYGAVPVCDTGQGRCVKCQDDGDCPGELHCEPVTGECRDCVTNDHCPFANSPICDPASRQCTSTCVDSGDCLAGPSYCDTTDGVCYDCLPTAGCPFCEQDTHSCVGCLTDDDCPPARPTCGPSLFCSAACTSDADCAGAVCDTGKGLCAECVVNGDCGIDEVCQVDQTCG